MADFFDFSSSQTIQFQEFSLNHLIPLFLVIFGVIVIFYFKDVLRESKHEKTIRYTMAITAIALEVSVQVWQAAHGQWNFAESLPLHLCRLTSYLAIISMLTKNEKIFRVAYFWSLAGVVSVMFPDISHGPDRYRYYHFMISHMLFFYMYMYMLFVLRMRLDFKAFKKSFIILFVLVVGFVIPINNIFDMNYMYLLEPGDTPFTIFYGNGYFLYVLGCITLTMIVMVLWYLPIHFYNKNRKKENR